ncbi:Kelch repeat-containing protein [Actinomadura sp. NTSP31]|uniref:Kelch repeat-containing protein n=1 Tax=Actinomadura sp. NTSP31 TaxID=1735447 RepID=UPI0035C18C00
MTVTPVATAAVWTAKAVLPKAAAWYGQHDGAIALDGTGPVLVAGGADAASAGLDLSAVFDPATGGWNPAGALAAARRLHTLTLLNDGRVLATGGLSGAAAGPGLRSAEIYDPAHHAWGPADPMVTPRWGHAAALLPDGSVLVSGGTGTRSGTTTKALRSAERFDPGTGKWHPADDMTDARTRHTAVPLAGGRVLVVGGSAPVGTPDDPALAFCELYDPATGHWTPTGSLLRGRRHHQATPLSGTTVLVTGGTAPGASGDGPFDPFSQRTAERYDLATGTWTAVRDMPSGRAFHRAVPFGAGKVLVVGGTAADRDEAGYRSAIVYDTGTNIWTPLAGLGLGRWSLAAAALSEGRAVVAGGVVRSGLAAADPAVTELTDGSELYGNQP